MRVSYSFTTLAIAAIVNAAAHNVAVGQSGLKYTPNTTYAAVGDTIVFSFYPMDHNVVSGPYDTPCRDGDGRGIYSGFIPSSEGVAVSQTSLFSLQIFSSVLTNNRTVPSKLP